MTTRQIELFWNEIDLIQKRHPQFFPERQKDFISLEKFDNDYTLTFSEEYDLSSNITLEIQLAFKLVADLNPVLSIQTSGGKGISLRSEIT